MKTYITILAIALFGLSSFRSTTPIDDAVIGKWQLKEQILITTLADSSQEEVKTAVFDGAIKEYKEDGTFQVSKGAGPYISGVYGCADGQILEHVKTSVMDQLVDSKNTLSYSLDRENKQLVISFRFPGMRHQKYKEIWEKKWEVMVKSRKRVIQVGELYISGIS